MQRKKFSQQGGFLKIIFLFVVFFALLWYFKIDVRGFVDSHPVIKDIFTKGATFLENLWRDYLKGAGSYIWNNIIIDLIWNNIAPLLGKK